MKTIDTSWRKQHKNINTKLSSHFNTEYSFLQKTKYPLPKYEKYETTLHYSFILIDER